MRCKRPVRPGRTECKSAPVCEHNPAESRRITGRDRGDGDPGNREHFESDRRRARIEARERVERGADGGGRHPGPIPPKSPAPAVPGGQQPFCPNRRPHHRTTGVR